MIENWEILRRAELAKQGAVLHEVIAQMREVLTPTEIAWLLTHEVRELMYELSHDEWRARNEQ